MKKWIKENPNDFIWWLNEMNEDIDSDDYVFSFDKKKRFHLFRDYPDKLSPEELEIFDRENPYWRKFFMGD